MSLLDNLPHLCTITKRGRTKDSLMGGKETRTVVSTNVPCWEQQASASETRKFSRPGQTVTTKIFFVDDPQLTESHEITITQRNGVDVPLDQQYAVQISTTTRPDTSAGFGVLFKVMGSAVTGQRT